MTSPTIIKFKSNRRIEKTDFFLTFLLCLFLLFTMLPDFFEFLPEAVSWYVGLLISMICFGLSVIKKRLNIHETIFYVFILFLLLISSIYNGNIKITIAIQYLRYIFFAISLIRIDLHKPLIYTLHALVCFYLLFCYLILKTDVTEITVNGVSQNVISVHLIFIQIILFIAEKKMFTKLLFASCLLSFVVIIWTGCRSGLITISFLTLCSFLSTLKNPRRRLLKIFALLLAVGVFIVIVAKTDALNEMFKMIASRTQKFSENVRFQMMSDFIDTIKSNFSDFLFGPKLSDVKSIHYWGDNPHNSFINAYAKFGFVGFATIMFLILRSLYKFARAKNYYCILLLALCIRSFTDIAAFPYYYDVLFYFFIFEYWIFQKNAYQVAKCKVRERRIICEQNQEILQ